MNDEAPVRLVALSQAPADEGSLPGLGHFRDACVGGSIILRRDLKEELAIEYPYGSDLRIEGGDRHAGLRGADPSGVIGLLLRSLGNGIRGNLF